MPLLNDGSQPPPPGLASIVLRDAAASDAARITGIYLAARKTLMPYAPLAHADADVARWIGETLLTGGGARAAVAGTLVVGFCAASLDSGGTGWIDQCYLAPAWTGRGVGAALLRDALARLPRPVRLYTFQANAGARRFYERAGFALVALSDGRDNEERCPDALYELAA